MIPLDSPIWADLEQAYGSAANVPAMLDKLRHMRDRDAWDDIWASLCHQGTVYTATYAAVPHIFDIFQSASEAEREEFIMFFGRVAASLDGAPIPKRLESEYAKAIQAVAEVAREFLLSRSWETADYLFTLQAVAGLNGCHGPGHFLEWIYNEECQINCIECDQFLIVAIRETGFFAYAAGDFLKPVSDEIEVKPRLAIDESWDGTIDCADDFSLVVLQWGLCSRSR